MKTDIIFSRSTDEWETPSDVYKALDDEFHFTLDPCATKENRKCEKYFTAEENGLEKNWGGEIVFCNPPYSRVRDWVKKCSDESAHATVVMLIPARTDTRWFHDYVYGKAEVRFIRGRLHYSNSKYSCPFPSMIVVFREDEQ